MNFKNWIDKVLNGNIKKNIMNCIIIMLIGILIILSSDIFESFNVNPKKAQKSNAVQVNTYAQTVNVSNNTYEEKIKRELADTLSLIKGAGKVSVMVYFDGGTEEVPAYNRNDTNNKTEENDTSGGKRIINETTTNDTAVTVTEGNETKPYVAKEMNPSIGGVLVISEGAENDDIKEKLTIAVSTVLNIPQCKVQVMAMKK